MKNLLHKLGFHFWEYWWEWVNIYPDLPKRPWKAKVKYKKCSICELEYRQRLPKPTCGYENIEPSTWEKVNYKPKYLFK